MYLFIHVYFKKYIQMSTANFSIDSFSKTEKWKGQMFYHVLFFTDNLKFCCLHAYPFIDRNNLNGEIGFLVIQGI